MAKSEMRQFDAKINGLLKYYTCHLIGYQVLQNYLSSFFLIFPFYFPIIYFIFSIPKCPKFLHLATSYHTLFFCLCTTMEVKNDGTVNMI